MYTAEDLKKLTVNEVIRLIEQKTGEPISVVSRLQLAILHGASKGGKGIHVINLDQGESYNEVFDYEALTRLLNQ